MVHTDTDILGNVVKQARQKSDMTIEKLAELVGVTDRYIYRIENEGKKPSFEVLHKIIQVLHIDPDLIFYPRKPTKDSEIEDLLRMLYNCDERSLEVVKATAKALKTSGGANVIATKTTKANSRFLICSKRK